MIIEEIKKIDSSSRELRKFAVTMAIVLLLIGELLSWRQKPYYWPFLVASVMFALLDWLAPAILKPIHKAWMTLAILMGWCVTRVILIILFYLVLTPMGLLLRLLRKDILNIKFGGNSSESYWIPRQTHAARQPDYTKQF